MNTETQDSVGGNLEVIPPSSLEAITKGEIDTQIATAHRYPRSIELFNKRAIAMATMDLETAESCLYCRPVGGGKNAEGMSVRMAEIVGACYGNLRVGAMVVEMTETFVKARGYAHDLETNFASASDIMESTVKSDGKTPYDARMRVTVAKAAVAKARRDATFQVVPRAIARAVERAVKELLNDETKMSMAQRRDGVLKWLEAKKIDPKRVWEVLGINGPGDLTPELLDTIAGLKTAIKDGDITIDEAFPAAKTVKPNFVKPPTSPAPVNQSAPTGAAPEAPAPENRQPSTPEVDPDDAVKAPLLAKIREAQQTYGFKDEDVIAFAKDRKIVSKGNTMKLDDFAPGVLKPIVDNLDKLVEKFGGESTTK